MILSHSGDSPSYRHLLFMKIGGHARESWPEIISRKKREILSVGFTFWGYGGATCHPVKQVQPFVSRMPPGESVTVGLTVIQSNFGATGPSWQAHEYSPDSVAWSRIPSGVIVTGSKHALVLDHIEPDDWEVDLREYEVAVGASAEKSAADYLRNRVDKACISLVGDRIRTERPIPGPFTRLIDYRATLRSPYSVFLR